MTSIGSREQFERRGESDSSWRFVLDRLLRRRPSLSTDAVEAYDSYGEYVRPSQDRLRRPADAAYRIGRNYRCVDVLLYGVRPGGSDDGLSWSDIDACVDFLEETSQFYGDEFTFDAVKEIVFMPPPQASGSTALKSEPLNRWRGFVVGDSPGVIFVNSKRNLEYDDLKLVLLHEFAHTLHGSDISDASEVVESVRHLNENPREVVAEFYADYMSAGGEYRYDGVARDALVNYLIQKTGRSLSTPIRRDRLKVARR